MSDPAAYEDHSYDMEPYGEHRMFASCIVKLPQQGIVVDANGVRVGDETGNQLAIPHPDAKPLVKAPFHAIPVTPAVFANFGGLAINDRAQVLDCSHQPVADLLVHHGKQVLLVRAAHAGAGALEVRLHHLLRDAARPAKSRSESQPGGRGGGSSRDVAMTTMNMSDRLHAAPNPAKLTPRVEPRQAPRERPAYPS